MLPLTSVSQPAIFVQERLRLLAEMESRAEALEQERAAQAAVAERIRAIQEKLLGGDEVGYGS